FRGTRRRCAPLRSAERVLPVGARPVSVPRNALVGTPPGCAADQRMRGITPFPGRYRASPRGRAGTRRTASGGGAPASRSPGECSTAAGQQGRGGAGQWTTRGTSSMTQPADVNERGTGKRGGKKNQAGDPGEQGPRGPVGPAGERGAQGESGPVGAVGERGDKGATGPVGPAGERGNKGANGPAGPAGEPGDKGEKGPVGPAGERGDKGTKGPAGPAGEPGDKGEKGPIGPAGERGDKGTKGPAGTVGEPGDKGDQGPVGARGATGRTGPQGPQGEQGPEGPVGPRGVAGVQGRPGPDGVVLLAQPVPADLMRNVLKAALDVSPRTLLDPRAGFRYVTTLASRLVKLQGGLLLRAVLTDDEDARTDPAGRSNVRSIA
ncbi:collagen-like protein, partial [Pseudonocardia sp. KRD-188]|nr:collagen-like protein [Pseudonocardia oceani]